MKKILCALMATLFLAPTLHAKKPPVVFEIKIVSANQPYDQKTTPDLIKRTLDGGAISGQKFDLPPTKAGTQIKNCYAIIKKTPITVTDRDGKKSDIPGAETYKDAIKKIIFALQGPLSNAFEEKKKRYF